MLQFCYYSVISIFSALSKQGLCNVGIKGEKVKIALVPSEGSGKTLYANANAKGVSTYSNSNLRIFVLCHPAKRVKTYLLNCTPIEYLSYSYVW